MQVQTKPLKPKAKMKKPLIITAISLVSLIIILLLAVPPIALHVIVNRHVDYGVPQNHPMQKIYTASDFGLTATDRMLNTEDGLSVWTSEVMCDDPKAVIIYLTGILQPSVTYYYGHSKWMQEQGYASILLEVRGHGKSDGDRICLGYEEPMDVQAVVDYIRTQPRYNGVPIVLHGVSMGGAIAVNAFGQIEEIDGLIAMSAYASFEDVFSDTLRHYGVPEFICAIEKPIARLALRAMFGERTNENVPIKQVQNIGDRPALFMAWAADPEVPAVNMQRLLNAAPDHCEGWLRHEENAGHFLVLDHEFENIALDTEYANRVLSFLQNNIAAQGARRQ